MRYLYGDSVPFPPQYDFLAALEVFCTQAARVVRLDAETRALRKAAEEGGVRARARGRGARSVPPRGRGGAQGRGEGLRRSRSCANSVRVDRAGAADRRRGAPTGASRRATATQQTTRGRVRLGGGEARDALEKMLVAVRLPGAGDADQDAVEEGQQRLRRRSSPTRAGSSRRSRSGGAEMEDWRGPRRGAGTSRRTWRCRSA